MASIPLPALDIRTPQPNDALGSFQKLMALRSLANQQQLQQQQIQSQQQEQQLRQQQINDQQLTQQYLRSNPQATLADTATALRGKISVAAQTNLMDTDATIRQKHAAATQAELDNGDKVHSQQQRIYNNVSNLSDDDLAKQWPQITSEWNAIPGNPMKLDPGQPINKAQLQQFGVANALQEAYLKQEQDKRKESAEITSTEAKAHESEAQAKKTTLETQLFAGPLAEANYRRILTDRASGKPLGQSDLVFARGYELANRKTTTQSDTLGVTSTSTAGPSGLEAGRGIPAPMQAPATPGAASGGSNVPLPSYPANANPSPSTVKGALVDEIGQYKADPATLSRLMVKHPDLLALVRQQYPDWDQTSYGAKNKIVQSYTSGTESKSINAINTAMGHAGELGEAIDALNNSNGLNMLRGIGNKIGVEVLGDDKVAGFKTIVHKLAPEITTAYVPGGGGEKERMANEGDFDPSLGDTQLRTNLGTTVRLLRSKIEAQEQQWNNTYQPSRPQDQFEARFLTPRAQQTFAKWGGPTSISGGETKTYQGHTYTRNKPSDPWTLRQ